MVYRTYNYFKMLKQNPLILKTRVSDKENWGLEVEKIQRNNRTFPRMNDKHGQIERVTNQAGRVKQIHA